MSILPYLLILIDIDKIVLNNQYKKRKELGKIINSPLLFI